MLAALQDGVFSVVRFQRKAAKQNGNGLSPAMELQMDGLSETHRAHVTVAMARCGIRTPAL